MQTLISKCIILFVKHEINVIHIIALLKCRSVAKALWSINYIILSDFTGTVN